MTCVILLALRSTAVGGLCCVPAGDFVHVVSINVSGDAVARVKASQIARFTGSIKLRRSGLHLMRLEIT